eukprot:scaffold12889_cov58-Phaeocystis_antarctica.AAC.3
MTGGTLEDRVLLAPEAWPRLQALVHSRCTADAPQMHHRCTADADALQIPCAVSALCSTIHAP